MTETDYISLEVAAELLGVAERTIRNYISQGKLTGYKPRIGRGAQLVSRAEVERLREIVPIDRGQASEPAADQEQN